LFAFFYYYSNILVIILIFSKDETAVFVEKRAHLKGAEAGHHHSSPGTINVPCPVKDAPADAGPAA
jgi:hypothetical protein